MRDNDSTTDETYEADDRADSFFPFTGSAFPYGLSPLSRENVGGETVDEGTAPASETSTSDATEDDGGSWWDEGLISLLLIAGVVLFVIPEPATSAFGILLISVGVVAWLVDWAL
ncbi:hypothetical protein [Haladaptatus salinisoli]|uniref:hypothetical protein n=1 Tax=Haladaptatus salinisoli TaxID=2884876 RepID=UPI001D0A6260|nr:hypothetical protein [Haladaptatus salinisoli]